MAKASIEVVHIVVREGDWRRLVQSLARIERALGIIHEEQENNMAELDDRLAELKAVADTNSGKLAHLITDFENRGPLTDDQRAALDALKAEIVGNSDAIDAADPVTPGDGTPLPAGDTPAAE
jgi:uncharacterized coiled-coil protein SlyX